MTDDEQELVDALGEMAQWFNKRGEKASGLICTRAAIHIAGSEPSVRPEARLPDDVRDSAIRIICCGLPHGVVPGLCAAPNCACYEENGKPIVERLWALFSGREPQNGSPSEKS